MDPAGLARHDQDAPLGPDDVGDDQGEVGDPREVVLGAPRVVGFALEVELVREGDFDF